MCKMRKFLYYRRVSTHWCGCSNHTIYTSTLLTFLWKPNHKKKKKNLGVLWVLCICGWNNFFITPLNFLWLKNVIILNYNECKLLNSSIDNTTSLKTICKENSIDGSLIHQTRVTLFFFFFFDNWSENFIKLSKLNTRIWENLYKSEASYKLLAIDWGYNNVAKKRHLLKN